MHSERILLILLFVCVVVNVLKVLKETERLSFDFNEKPTNSLLHKPTHKSFRVL